MNELYKNDLNSFLEFYEANHICPYYFCAKDEIKKFIKTYFAQNLIKCDDDFVYFFRSMLKKLVGDLDSHTIIRTRNEYDHWPLKLEVDIKSEKVFVTAANKNLRNYVGREVAKINGVEVGDLLKEAERAISYSTNGWYKAESGRFLSSKSALRSLPSIRSDIDKVIYAFADGETLEASDEAYQQTKPQNYSFKIDNNSLVLYFTACSEDYPNQVHNVVEQLQEKVLENNIEKFVLDLSGNMGGNDLIIKPLIEWLNSAKLEKYVKVDRYVQSAGLFAINDMCKIGAKVIGSEIGSGMNHIGNNLRHELPSGRFLTIVATRYFYLDDDNNYCVTRTREEFQKLDSRYVCSNCIL